MSETQNPRGASLRKVTLAGLGANLGLAAAKLAGGVFGNSRAMLADALHTATDITSDLAVLIGSRFWGRPPDASHPYGHRRIETVISVGMGAGLGAMAILMGWHAVEELRSGKVAPPPGMSALAAAVLSIVVKEWMYRWTMRVGRRLHSLSLQANAWHHRSDAFSSLPVLVAVMMARLAPGWTFLDRVGALVMALVVLQASWRILRQALVEITETGVPARLREEIEALVTAIPGVRDAHRIRSRYVGGRVFVDLHVLVDPNMPVRESHEVATEVSRRMVGGVRGVADVVVHIEPDEESEPSPGTLNP